MWIKDSIIDMAIIFSKGCEYGIQATLYIGTQGGRRVGIREAAEVFGLPIHFLAKILQALSEKKVLSSFKGVNGGFVLHSAPEDIRIMQIVEAIDGGDLFEKCVLGFPDCKDSHPCPVHHTWGATRDSIRSMLSHDSLADLMAASEKKIAYIKRTNKKK
jgi:Rrf2 family protein